MRRACVGCRALAWMGALALAFAAGGAAAGQPKREVPDYDGRGGEPTTPGDVALWVPRVIFSPVYFTTEYLLRRPIGAVIAEAERSHVPEFLYDIFFFGPEHKVGVLPTAFIDFGFNPSVGLYAFWDDAFFKGHDLRLTGSVWTSDWITGSLIDRIAFHGDDTVTFRLSGLRRPDYTFFGIGPRTLQANLSRYGQDRLEASTLLDFPLWRASRVETGIAVRSVSIYDGHYSQDPSLVQEAALGVYPLPDGFGRGYTEELNRLLVAFDSRRPRPEPASGVRVELEAEQGSDVRRTPDSGWVRWGGTAGAFYDVTGHNRVVSLALTTLFADPLGASPIPFTELVSLGGSGPMRGFFPGRLADRSAAVATAHYRWPIWAWLDGSLQAAVGNVFAPHLQGLSAGLMRFSGAIGIESVGSPDSSFELLVGLGTETFDHGGQVDSARLVVGTNRGF
jgi:hypothetical protein